MSDALDDLKRDEAALWRAYEDLGGKRSSDPLHSSCPFCLDETGFMIGTGGNGIAGWRCYAGKSQNCSHTTTHKFTGSIVDLLMRARGLDSASAVKEALERYGRASAAAGPRGAPAAVAQTPAKPKRKGKLHLTVDLALEAAQFGISQRPGNSKVTLAKYWQYTDAKGEPRIAAARFNLLRNGKPAKEFSPVHRDGNGWRVGLGAWGSAEKLCPLYALPAVLKAEGQHLHIAEGEKVRRCAV